MRSRSPVTRGSRSTDVPRDRGPHRRRARRLHGEPAHRPQGRVPIGRSSQDADGHPGHGLGSVRDSPDAPALGLLAVPGKRGGHPLCRGRHRRLPRSLGPGARRLARAARARASRATAAGVRPRSPQPDLRTHGADPLGRDLARCARDGAPRPRDPGRARVAEEHARSRDAIPGDIRHRLGIRPGARRARGARRGATRGGGGPRGVRACPPGNGDVPLQGGRPCRGAWPRVRIPRAGVGARGRVRAG